MTKPHLKLLTNRDILIWREDGWQKWGYVTVLGNARKYGRHVFGVLRSGGRASSPARSGHA